VVDDRLCLREDRWLVHHLAADLPVTDFGMLAAQTEAELVVLSAATAEGHPVKPNAAGQLARHNAFWKTEEAPAMTTPSAAETPPDQQHQPVTSSPPPAGVPQVQQHRILRTRAGATWVAAAIFAAILLLLLIFILENGHTVAISFFGASGHLPLGVALLLAAVLGVLLVAIPGTARIIQLRITARRHRMLDAGSAAQGQSPQAPSGNGDPAQAR
jgi:uncharacterized integral membrane protein